MDLIPYGRQAIDEDDISAVLDVLKSDFLTGGPVLEKFEEEFAHTVGAKYAISVCNGTAALHLAMLACRIGTGDRVLTSPNTFLASANSVIYAGGTPDFVDIDPLTYNLDIESLKKSWSDDVKAVIPVAYAGQAPDMASIYKFAKENSAYVIEDVCHGTGGAIEENGEIYKLGGHSFADLSVFSLHPVKTITSGEGGMLTTNNLELAEKARLLRNHGMVRQPEKFNGCLPDYGPWTYEMQELGLNYRLTEMQAALGLSQLKKLEGFVKRRREIVETYNSAFQALQWLQTPSLRNPLEQGHISWHLYSPSWDFQKLGRSRSEVMAFLRDQGILTQVLYIPVYLQPYYQENYGYRLGKCANAEYVYERALSLPLFPSMNEVDVQHVIKSVYQLM